MIVVHSPNAQDRLKVFCFRIGKKYGPEYEEYLSNKLGEKYDLIFIRNSLDYKIALQWNKMFLMNLDYDKPIVVIDIDVLLENNYYDIFDIDIVPGEFLAMPSWWNNKTDYSINGGFYKYYPKDCKYIYDKFMDNPKHWQSHYIKKGVTIGPVNGEQNFVEDNVKTKLKLKLLPNEWVSRWTNNEKMNRDICARFSERTEATNLFNNNTQKFNKDIRLVHFTTSLNKPHESSLYRY